TVGRAALERRFPSGMRVQVPCLPLPPLARSLRGPIFGVYPRQPEFIQGPDRPTEGLLRAAVGGDVADKGEGRRTGLLPVRGQVGVDVPIGVGGIAATTRQPYLHHLRRCPAQEEQRRQAQPRCQLQKWCPPAFLTEVGVNQYPAALRQQFLCPAQTLCVSPL